MGSNDDKTDDLEFDDIREERNNAVKFFDAFKDIEIELSSPPEISVNDNGNQAEVRNHYRIKVFVESNNHKWFGEGDNLFVFEKRSNEWRITEWYDEAFSREEIRIANNLNGGFEDPLGQLISWAALKSIL